MDDALGQVDATLMRRVMDLSLQRMSQIVNQPAALMNSQSLLDTQQNSQIINPPNLGNNVDISV